MFSNLERLLPLDCGIQHYAWGALADEEHKPFIADLTGAHAEENQPFAELWIGAHPKLPAHIDDASGNNIPLDQAVADAPEAILGPPLTRHGITKLPFLLKVLDCVQPLSIQAHPDKSRANELHRQDPEHYPDPNHKPEIAISLEGLDAFCQFRDVDAIREDIIRLPALKTFFNGLPSERLSDAERKSWLKQAYKRIFSAETAELRELYARITEQIETDTTKQTHQDMWFLKLKTQRPEDPGVLSAYFLNIVNLAPGEGMFLQPNEPHAYLQGTIIECMASSDNVVRAGLTSKFIDRDTLLGLLTYEDGLPQKQTGNMIREGEYVYQVPVPEFQVESYRPGKDVKRTYSSEGMVSLMLVLEGEAEIIYNSGETLTASRGSTWLWPAALSTADIRYLASDTQIIRARPNIASFKDK